MKISRQGMAQATILLIAGTLLSRVLGYVREIVIAYQYGATASTDAYLVASILPMGIAGMVAGAITVAFIPVFTEYRVKAGEEEAWRIASTVLNLAIIFLVASSVIYLVAAPFLIPLFGPGLAPETQQLAVRLSQMLTPAIVFTGLTGLIAAILNAYRHFMSPAFAGLLYNFGMIAGALLLGDTMGIAGLVVGVVAGAVAHLLVLLVPLFGHRGYYRASLSGLRHPAIKQIGMLILPFIVGSASGQINLLVDRMLASGLVEGSIASLNFATRIMSLPVGIFAGAVATAVYPYLSEQASKYDLVQVRRTFSEGLRLLWFIVIPITAGLLILSEPVVRLLFERGAFDAVATQMTTVALFYYSLGIVANTANVMIVRVYFAMQDTITPIKLGLWAIALNIILNLILVRFMDHAGLALASSLAAGLNFLMLAFYLRRKLEHLDGGRILRSTMKAMASAVAMSAVVWAGYVYSQPHLDMTQTTNQAAQLVGLMVLGAAVYFGVAALLKTEELTNLVDRVKAKLVRPKPQA